MIMLRFFEKKAFGGCKSQIFVFGYWIAGRGAILRIRRLRRSVSRAHGCSAPPLSPSPIVPAYLHNSALSNKALESLNPSVWIVGSYIQKRIPPLPPPLDGAHPSPSNLIFINLLNGALGS